MLPRSLGMLAKILHQGAVVEEVAQAQAAPPLDPQLVSALSTQVQLCC